MTPYYRRLGPTRLVVRSHPGPDAQRAACGGSDRRGRSLGHECDHRWRRQSRRRNSEPGRLQSPRRRSNGPQPDERFHSRAHGPRAIALSTLRSSRSGCSRAAARLRLRPGGGPPAAAGEAAALGSRRHAPNAPPAFAFNPDRCVCLAAAVAWNEHSCPRVLFEPAAARDRPADAVGRDDTRQYAGSGVRLLHSPAADVSRCGRRLMPSRGRSRVRRRVELCSRSRRTALSLGGLWAVPRLRSATRRLGAGARACMRLTGGSRSSARRSKRGAGVVRARPR